MICYASLIKAFTLQDGVFVAVGATIGSAPELSWFCTGSDKKNENT
jgi:hypothetical protein